MEKEVGPLKAKCCLLYVTPGVEPLQLLLETEAGEPGSRGGGSVDADLRWVPSLSAGSSVGVDPGSPGS